MDATKVLFPSDIISMDVFPDGESIIYTQDNFVHLLNATATTMYMMINEKNNLGAICQKLDSMYEQNGINMDIETDVCLTVEEMISKGLIYEN